MTLVGCHVLQRRNVAPDLHITALHTHTVKNPDVLIYDEKMRAVTRVFIARVAALSLLRALPRSHALVPQIARRYRRRGHSKTESAVPPTRRPDLPVGFSHAYWKELAWRLLGDLSLSRRRGAASPPRNGCRRACRARGVLNRKQPRWSHSKDVSV